MIFQSKSKKDGLWGYLHNGRAEEEEGGIDFSLGNVLRIMFFTHKKENGQEREQLVRIADSLDKLEKRMDTIEVGLLDPHAAKQRRKSSRMSARGGEFSNPLNISESGDTMDMDSEDNKSQSTEPKEERDDLINPFWIEDRDLGRGEVDHLSGMYCSKQKANFYSKM